MCQFNWGISSWNFSNLVSFGIGNQETNDRDYQSHYLQTEIGSVSRQPTASISQKVTPVEAVANLTSRVGQPASLQTKLRNPFRLFCRSRGRVLPPWYCSSCAVWVSGIDRTCSQVRTASNSILDTAPISYTYLLWFMIEELAEEWALCSQDNLMETVLWPYWVIGEDDFDILVVSHSNGGLLEEVLAEGKVESCPQF